MSLKKKRIQEEEGKKEELESRVANIEKFYIYIYSYT